MMATVLLGGKHIDMGRHGKSRAMNPVRVMMENNDDARLRMWIEVLITADGNAVSGAESTTINSAIQALRRSPPSGWKLSAIYALIAGQDQALAHKLATYEDRSDEESGPGTTVSHAD